MAYVNEATQGKTRDLPISADLRVVLLAAAEASGIDTVRVTSGGQCRRGTCTKRTGSERHDDGQAADLQLLLDGSPLAFTNDHGLSFFRRFVTEAAAAGATGIGGGIGYMGEETIHVGFGSRAVWGAGGKAANAPAWLVNAAKDGWGNSAGLALEGEELDSPDEEEETDFQ